MKLFSSIMVFVLMTTSLAFATAIDDKSIVGTYEGTAYQSQTRSSLLRLKLTSYA